MEDSIIVNGVEYVKKDNIEAPKVDGMKSVLVRSYAAGVHFGHLKSIEHTQAGTFVTLVNTRRVHYWSGAASLSQMAIDGVKNPDECRFSVVIPENNIQNCIEIIPLSNKAIECLNSVPVWKM